jgi:hypothetical protein
VTRPCCWSGLLAAALLSLFASRAAADASWTPDTYAFATREEAAATLGAADDYITHLTPLDRAMRLNTDRAVSAQEFQSFAAAAARSWTAAETEALRVEIARITDALNALHVPAPRKILLIKTSGAEEGNAAYTRGTAVMLPEAMADADGDSLLWLLAHETFHIITRQNPALREELYRVIGFVKVEPFTWPADVAAHLVSNPDVQANDHFARLTADDDEVCGAPVMMFTADHYDPAGGGDFFAYVEQRYLVSRHIAERHDGTPTDLRVLPRNRVTGLERRAGENTTYVIHPEEILAENFAMLVTGLKKPMTPTILDGMRAVFGGAKAPGPVPPCP